MSRTYRRKNITSDFYTEEWTWIDALSTMVKLPMEAEESKRMKAVYRSDAYEGWNAPAHFRRGLTRIHRSRNKAILKQAMIDDNDEPMFIPDIKDAAWEWW